MSQNADSMPQNVWADAFKSAFASKPFIVAVVLLALAAFGMGAATQFLQLRFKKNPVPLQQPLETVPRELAHWRQITDDEPLETDIEQTLGTKTYIFRDYVDTRLVGPMEVEEMMGKPNADRRRMLALQEQKKPRSVIHMGVTYYTGMVDTVAHVPDRCYIADGYAPTEYEERDWKISDKEKVRVRFISFEDATGFTSRVNKNVAYFFQVNGELQCSPLSVRYLLQDLRKSDVYYAKIELMMTYIKNRDDAARVMTDFLTQAMPEIRKCLPANGVKQVEQTTPTTKP